MIRNPYAKKKAPNDTSTTATSSSSSSSLLSRPIQAGGGRIDVVKTVPSTLLQAVPSVSKENNGAVSLAPYSSTLIQQEQNNQQKSTLSQTPSINSVSNASSVFATSSNNNNNQEKRSSTEATTIASLGQPHMRHHHQNQLQQQQHVVNVRQNQQQQYNSNNSSIHGLDKAVKDNLKRPYSSSLSSSPTKASNALLPLSQQQTSFQQGSAPNNIIDLTDHVPQQQQSNRPTSSSSSSTAQTKSFLYSSQLSQQSININDRLVWNNSNKNINNNTNHKNNSNTNFIPNTTSTNSHINNNRNDVASSSSSSSLSNHQKQQQDIINRYHTTLPPEIRFNSTDPIVQAVQDEYRTKLIKNAALSEPLQNGWTLYSHQKKAIIVALLMRRQILALDMGLGKTLIGCCYARAYVRTFTTLQTPRLQVLIICPVSLKQEWERTASTVVGLTLRNGSSGSTKKNSGNDDEEEDDYDDNLDKKPRSRKRAKTRKSGKENDIAQDSTSKNNNDGVVSIVSWAKVPYSAEEFLGPKCRNDPYIVIADEAHSMQSMASARTRDALQLMLDTNCIGVLLLTGTPMKNGKPANLFPLLKAVKHPFGNHQRAYEAHFCGGRDMSSNNGGFGGGRPMWVATGATNLDQLRVLTKSHMLHMTKDDVLKDLPKQTRIKKPVFVSSRSEMRHNEAMRKLSMIYENKSDPFQQEAILGAVQSVRLVDSFAKVTATVEVAREILRKEAAVVIFTSFVDVAKLVHQKLSDYGWTGELLTGETPAKKRQGMVDKFQNGLSPVFICTFGAGGVGLTLTAACTVILLDRPWTPGDVHQAEDRVRRIGQTKPVTSIWMSAFELDKQIDEMIESKSQTSSTVLSESNATNGNNSNPVPKLSILKMVHNFLSNNNQSSASSGNGLKQATLQEYGHGTARTY